MKKIFAVSLIAMTAVTSARADIASQAYVDGKFATKADVGDKANLTTPAETIVAAINAINSTSSSAIQGVKVNGAALTPTEGVVDVTVPTGELASLDAVGSAQITNGSVALEDLASGVQTSLGKADTALQSSDVDQTYSATSANAQSGKAVAEAVSAVSTTADGLNTRLTAAEGKITTAEGKITTAEGDIDALEALVGNTAVATQISTATSDMETQTHAAATYQTLDNLATSTSWSTDKSSDTKYASAKAVDAAITAAGYDDTALAGRVTTAEGKITTAEGDIDALEALVGNTAVATQISTATSDMETQTHAAATYQTLDNLATSTSWSTDKSSDSKYASAKAVDTAISAAGGQTAQQVSDAIDTKIGTLNDTSGAAQNGKWVTAVTQTNGKITATMEDPLASFTKLEADQGDGVYALTATASNGTITGYKWEMIQRAE